MIPKTGLLSLILGGLAAYGVYKYTKMTEEEKEHLKQKGKKFFEDNIPQDLRGMFGGKKATTAENTYE